MNAPTVPADAASTENPASSPSGRPSKPLVLRVVGIGGAGGNMIAQFAQTDLRELNLMALHTSSRILEMTVAPEKFLIGADLMHGLGAGGDPSLARVAAEHDTGLLKKLCEGTDLLFIVTGLGGGTGTGVAPVLARVAKECGALVLAVATMPFELEGLRRRRAAEQGLKELKTAADTVITLPNQKIFRMVDEKTSVLDSFKITNDLLAQGIRGIWQMLARPGLLRVEFADLCALLRDRHCESSFASVQAQGEGRAREVADMLLASPLLDNGQALAEAEAVVVNVAGGPDLSMADVNRVMEEIHRRTEHVHLVMGASISDHFQGRIGLTLIVSRREVSEADPPVEGVRFTPSMSSARSYSAAGLDLRIPPVPLAGDGESRFDIPGPEQPTVTAEDSAPPSNSPPRRAKSSFRLQQGDLPLEMVSKGRFEKTAPTIHRGEDLDLPTYVRRGIPLN